jgi:hypothetical protein
MVRAVTSCTACSYVEYALVFFVLVPAIIVIWKLTIIILLAYVCRKGITNNLRSFAKVGARSLSLARIT